ncbi:hypothetical protein ON010_g11403 [Phytophthora cinnamomi]|nr:hypothetical protein ON010_g11403 [Phytophthora cinnamomi]
MKDTSTKPKLRPPPHKQQHSAKYTANGHHNVKGVRGDERTTPTALIIVQSRKQGAVSLLDDRQQRRRPEHHPDRKAARAVVSTLLSRAGTLSVPDAARTVDPRPRRTPRGAVQLAAAAAGLLGRGRALLVLHVFIVVVEVDDVTVLRLLAFEVVVDGEMTLHRLRVLLLGARSSLNERGFLLQTRRIDEWSIPKIDVRRPRAYNLKGGGR